MKISHILSSWLKSTPPPKSPLPEADAKLALGALLVHVAKADHSYAVEEIQQIDRILAQFNELNVLEAAKMRATCEAYDKEWKDTDRFTALIRQNITIDLRRDMLTALWDVVMADGVERPEELNVVTEMCNAMGLDDVDMQTARNRARKEM